MPSASLHKRPVAIPQAQLAIFYHEPAGRAQMKLARQPDIVFKLPGNFHGAEAVANAIGQRRQPKIRSDEDALTGRIVELATAYGRYGSTTSAGVV